jgi:RNA polymerase sigma factor (sigma-70 family)
MDGDDDGVLVERWRGGDAAAVRTLFERYFERIYRFFETKCTAKADELTQSTFLACMRAKNQYRSESSFRSYLYTIARHELHRELRRYQRHDQRLDFEISPIAELISTPATRLARFREQQRLVEALQSLPVAQQTLLELHYWDDLEIGELAEIFEAPAATIRTRLHRARKALRERIEQSAPREALQTLETMDRWVRAQGAAAPDPGTDAQ